ncbi:MAG: right-handed parallel beta-helix repeat-containing protein [Acidobacteriota bacterium]
MPTKKSLVLLLTVLFTCLVAAPSSALVCGDTIYSHTVLTHDLIDCPSPGLVIGEDHLTLDLNGHTISGKGSGTGIVVETGRHDIRIVGPGTVSGFHLGIRAIDSERVDVEGVTLDRHSGSAIAYTDTGESTLRGNTLTANQSAISFQNLHSPRQFNRILDNRIDGGGVAGGSGISLELDTDVEIRSNFIVDTGWAITLTGASRVMIEGNVLIDNHAAVVLISHSFGPMADNAVVENKIYDNVFGVYVGSGAAASHPVQQTTVKRNVFQGGSQGIVLDDALVVGSGLFQNQLWGLIKPIVDDGTGTVTAGNVCDGLPC